MINVWTCNLYDELALWGVTYDCNSWMMKEESWFLLKLYNEDFLSDDHYITHKSWVQDASRRVCLNATKSSTYNLRTCSIHYVKWVGFLPGLKRVSYLPSDDLRKDNIGVLQEMVRAHIPTITKQTLRYELSVSHVWTLTNSHRADR
jgi:hypothetical protein